MSTRPKRAGKEDVGWLFHHDLVKNGDSAVEGVGSLLKPGACESLDLIGFTRWARTRKRLGDNSIRSYLVWIRGVDRFLHESGDCLTGATPAALDAYLETIPQTASSRNSACAAFRAWFSFVEHFGAKTANPTGSLKLWASPPKMPHPVDMALIPGFLDECFADNIIVGTMAVLYLNTALRLDELRTRRRKSRAGRRMFLRQKGGGERVVILSDEARLALDTYLAQAPESQWMWPSPCVPDQPVSANWVYVHIRQAGANAGIEDMHPHRLRDTGISEFYRLSKDPLATQRFAGHADFGMTRRYIEIVDMDANPFVESMSFLRGRSIT